MRTNTHGRRSQHCDMQLTSYTVSSISRSPSSLPLPHLSLQPQSDLTACILWIVLGGPMFPYGGSLYDTFGSYSTLSVQHNTTEWSNRSRSGHWLQTKSSQCDLVAPWLLLRGKATRAVHFVSGSGHPNASRYLQYCGVRAPSFLHGSPDCNKKPIRQD